MTALTAARLQQLLQNAFPADATSWAQATDEVRELHRLAREQVQEQTGKMVEVLVDFRWMTTPSMWNTKGVAAIVQYYNMMDEDSQLTFCQNNASVIEWLEHNLSKKVRS